MLKYSMNNTFSPTYLYIKRHSVTGKCYFGKTTQGPVKYKGSGKHWLRHIKLHGKEFVETLWFKLFIDQTECTKIALLFSEQQDIVKSEVWLNIIPEDGIGGGPIGNKNALGFKHSPEYRAKKSAEMMGTKNSLGNKNTLGFKHPKIICPHCKLEGANNLMKRYHFDNCRKKS